MISLKILYIAFYFNNNFECSFHPHMYLLVGDNKDILWISFFSIGAYESYIVLDLALCRPVSYQIH